MAGCSVPNIFGIRKWCNKHFADLCKKHDEEYVAGSIIRKFRADVEICKAVVKRGFWYIFPVVIIWTMFCGTFYWIWKTYVRKYRRLRNKNG